MFIPVCEERWYHGAAPSFGMGAALRFGKESYPQAPRVRTLKRLVKCDRERGVQRACGPLVGCRGEALAKEVIRMNCIAERRVGAVACMSRL